MGQAMLALLLIAAVTAPPRMALGQYGRWGAFRDGDPLHCFAIAEPAGTRRDGVRAYAAVSEWPGRRIAGQFHVRLGEGAPGRRATARIGTLAVPLLIVGGDAWAPDARDDRRIGAAMRRGDRLAIEVRDADGRRHTDRYPLAGASSALDAATVGCLR